MTDAKDKLSPSTIRMINFILESILFEPHTEELINYVVSSVKQTLESFEEGMWSIGCSAPRKDGVFKVFITELKSGDEIIFVAEGYTINNLIGLQKLEACTREIFKLNLPESPDRDIRAKWDDLYDNEEVSLGTILDTFSQEGHYNFFDRDFLIRNANAFAEDRQNSNFFDRALMYSLARELKDRDRLIENIQRILENAKKDDNK